ncbi:MAG: 50S ribosomal protein L9 [Woeseiaceae bacterium]|jgi:large subunit ribosomal protein L9|nr:50S ribosomal protein L9 [Woeseiaceae bacterium]MBT7275517.1 50S ribosomal protein L9 [Woeseiaceae bacterium]MDG1016173.1 50S ribosomal protein L9 [Woeseiaceae bacterium]MDG1712516.1 50S ribosomal protein L9 [Woeseiaceae bacterium]MDG1866077.1 50S ribosomal protein L9 [Woeseiaceae bacterium]|tara:strand:- start:5957 stop:6406 length:450 start_codon:yes stop_codon:yes gene_type:complete
MNVILLDKVENLGAIGDLVSVKSGYGRNYLIPAGKAALATAENIKDLEAKRSDLEKKAAEELAAAKSRGELIQGMQLVIPANVGSEGKLFGSVGPVDIAEAFNKVGVDVERSEIRMADGPIHEIGESEIILHLHTDLDITVNVNVVPEE